MDTLNMTTQFAGYDWKKFAAQGAAPNDAVEKAFFDQAMTFVSNKAAPIMRDPYRLGFEIVQKNDDNTKMVGIAAFRINRDLYYAPAFFLNGEIKGTDLFYRHTTKTFVPLTEDWVKFLLEQDEQAVGQGISRSERKKHPADMQLRRIAYPPFTHNSGIKYASADESACEVFDDGTAFQWEDFLKEAATQGVLEPIIREFLLEDGGWNAFEKIAYAVEKSTQFAERLVASCGDAFMPAELAQPVKKASTTPKLVLHLGLNPGVKNASDFFSKGYYLADDREDKDTTPVYQAGPVTLQTIGDPGLYDILLKDGDTEKAWCARKSDESLCSSSDHGIALPCDEPCSPFGDATFTSWVFVTKSGKTGTAKLLIGSPVSEDGKAAETPPDEADFSKLKTTMESDGVYRVYDSKAGTFSAPFYVVGKRTHNDIDVYDIVPWSHSSARELKYNPDYARVNFPDGVIGEPGKFIKITGKGHKVDNGSPYGVGDDYYTFDYERIEPGDEDNLQEWILGNQEIKQATLLHRDGEFCLRTGYKTCSAWMGKIAAVVALAGDLNIRAGAVDEIITGAEKTGSYSFYMEPPLHKLAGTIRLMQQPNFQTSPNSDFGVEVDQPQSFAIDSQTETDEPPDHRVGDAWDPSMGQGPMKDDGLPMDTLLNSTPQQLAQLAQQDSIPHLFEHGVVGSLVNTYDSAAMIDKYLPKMEQGLDCAGRTLFLFYWKPGDFQNLYGVDDMTNLENKLLSNFKSWGDLVLDLMKKTRNKQRGSVPLAA
jgi:hypothetical protein